MFMGLKNEWFKAWILKSTPVHMFIGPSHRNIYTVKHVYSDHAYNEMTLIAKHLGIPTNILYISL